MGINKILRYFYCWYKFKGKNNNMNPSIISANCIGGVVSSDFGLRFYSPTVNLYILPNDFIKFCSNIKFYLNKNLEFYKSDINCPTAKLGDITIYFLHYKTEKDAERKWEERKNRINYDNLYFVMTDRDGCTYEDLREFDKLTECKNKVVFTHKSFPEIKSAFYLPEYKYEYQVGIITSFRKFSYKRPLDEFDWIKFLNN